MPAGMVIVFRPEGTRKEYNQTVFGVYKLGENTTLHALSRPGWCHHCKDFTDCEEIPSVEDLDREIKDLQDESSALYDFTAKAALCENQREKDAAIERRLSLATLRRTWREDRLASPKCLRCGTTDVLILPIDEQIASPCSQGTLEVNYDGSLVSVVGQRCLLTPEGDLIPPPPVKPKFWLRWWQALFRK